MNLGDINKKYREYEKALEDTIPALESLGELKEALNQIRNIRASVKSKNPLLRNKARKQQTPDQENPKGITEKSRMEKEELMDFTEKVSFLLFTKGTYSEIMDTIDDTKEAQKNKFLT